MAVTANQITPRAEGCRAKGPVAASTHLYEKTLAFVNASTGYIDDDTNSGANAFAGIVVAEADNSSGSNGDINCELERDGAWLLTGSGFAITDVGKAVYAVDNYTISLTAAGNVFVGRIREYVSSTKVWVDINVRAQAYLTQSAYTQTYSTASKTVPAATASAVVTTAATNSTPYGYSQAQADAIVAAVNANQVDILNVKKVVTALIDDLQALGLVG